MSAGYLTREQLPSSWRPALAGAAVFIWLCVLFLAASSGPPALGNDAALEALGLGLLADRRLSASATISCFDCHQPERGYTDGRPVATPEGHNTPPLWTLGQRQAFGWFTPEVASLEEMVLRPLADPAEMGPQSNAALGRLRADPTVVAAYHAAFPDAHEIVTWQQTAAALAAAVRAISAPESAYDRFVAGDETALSPEALRGGALFAEVGCASCHRPPLFATDSYHAVGVLADPTKNGGRARVPTLRGVTHTAPFFHDGSAPTLESVVRSYQRGGQVAGSPTSPAIRPLQLTEQDIRDLVAFLDSL